MNIDRNVSFSTFFILIASYFPVHLSHSPYCHDFSASQKMLLNNGGSPLSRTCSHSWIKCFILHISRKSYVLKPRYLFDLVVINNMWAWLVSWIIEVSQYTHCSGSFSTGQCRGSISHAFQGFAIFAHAFKRGGGGLKQTYVMYASINGL